MIGQVHPLGNRAIFDNCSNTTIHSAPMKYCYTCKEPTDVGNESPYMNVLPGMNESDDVDWVNLASTSIGPFGSVKCGVHMDFGFFALFLIWYCP